MWIDLYDGGDPLLNLSPRGGKEITDRNFLTIQDLGAYREIKARAYAEFAPGEEDEEGLYSKSESYQHVNGNDFSRNQRGIPFRAHFEHLVRRISPGVRHTVLTISGRVRRPSTPMIYYSFSSRAPHAFHARSNNRWRRK